MSNAHLTEISGSKNFDVPGSSREQNNASSQRATGSEAEARPFICYGASTAQPNPGEEPKRQYRACGTKLITVPQATNLKSAVKFAERTGLALNAHCIIHWVGTDAGDDPDGKLFCSSPRWICAVAQTASGAVRWCLVSGEAVRWSG